ncbi:MAG: 2-oxo acid dehydrogenase subunit E2 [Deltaproteobacteria bacterium]|nr:2-oxo acid dehydrogenase subunit E2 [Deltaproteobacteria bacterium]
MDFKLPDMGEGVQEGEIVKWFVKEGDTVSEDQPLVEVMTDKATVEIPSPAKGKIQKIYFKEGQTVQVDSVLVTIADNGTSQKIFSAPSLKSSTPAPKPTSTLTSAATSPSTSQASAGAVLATPAIRKLAKDLGVDLSKVKGTGHEGRITQEDVKKQTAASGAKGSEGSAHFTPLAIPKLGPEERFPLHGVRKAIAQRLQMSKHYAPHYTYVEEVDVTDLMALRNKMKADAEKQAVKLTYLAFIVKALMPALKAFPYLNASLDETTQEIVLKKYYNIGVAVATSDGLMVPVIKDVDKKKLFDVAKEIVVLSEKVKAHKATPDDLKGSSFTVTSIGSIGGVFATPIINYPDVAILGINKIVERPVVRGGKIVPRQMLYLSLTLDHRVVDGALAAEFMNKLIEILQNPKVISL